MSWKFVYNPHLYGGNSFDSAEEKSRGSGYKFFLFNGMVFFLGDDKTEPTGITIEDLF